MENENKKHRVRLNIVDVIIIAVVILALAFVGYKLLSTGSVSSPTQTVYLTLYEAECADYVIDNVNIGDAASDGTSSLFSLGTVANIVTDKSVSYEYDETDQEYKRVPKPDHSSVYITLEIQGTLTDNGVVVDSQLYAVGHTMILYAGYAKFYLQVYDISTQMPEL